jgi:hypothetical protein
MKWRKWNRVLHRDFGYFFAATSIIYAISGIALNHIRDWNPNYIISTQQILVDDVPGKREIDQAWILELVDQWDQKRNYKKYYFPSPNRIKIFLDGGTIYLDVITGEGLVEKIRKRPVFYEMNYLHYNPGQLWTWFSDIYAGALVLLSITGLFILKGKNGITGRGAWLTAAGIILPLIFLYFIL